MNNFQLYTILASIFLAKASENKAMLLILSILFLGMAWSEIR